MMCKMQGIGIILSFFGFLTVHLSNGAISNCPAEGSGSPINSSTNGRIINYIESVLPVSISLLDEPKSVVTAPTTTNLNTTALTLDDLRYYNYFAASVYCPYDLLGHLTCCSCTHFNQTVTNYTTISNVTLGTKVLLTYHASKGEIVVTSRGSETIMNWVMNFDMVQVSVGSSIKVHQGFYISTMSIYYKVIDQILEWQRLYPNVSRIVIVGQSLGGAISQLIAFLIKSTDQFPTINLVLISYGSPRCGNKGFADYMNSLTIPALRVVNKRDIVPHLPPVNGMDLNLELTGEYYYHTLREVWINGSVAHFCAVDKYEDPNCSLQVETLYSFADHVNYMDVDYWNCLDLDEAIKDVINNPVVLIPEIPEAISDSLLG